MGPETMTVTNYANAYRQFADVVDGFTTATARLDETYEPLTVETDRAWNPHQTWDPMQWYINATPVEPRGVWDPGQWRINTATMDIFFEDKKDDMEDFDIPAGADTALLECFGVE